MTNSPWYDAFRSADETARLEFEIKFGDHAIAIPTTKSFLPGGLTQKAKDHDQSRSRGSG
ncbi:MAG: hypothetical protein R3D26_13515 [Cyanobacteriota/Melainabacteria group bacterium]